MYTPSLWLHLGLLHKICLFFLHSSSHGSMSSLPHDTMFLLCQGILSSAIVSADLTIFNVIVLGCLLICVVKRFANVGWTFGHIHKRLRRNLHVGQTCSLLVEEAVVHPFSQKMDNLFLHQPITFELMIGLLSDKENVFKFAEFTCILDSSTCRQCHQCNNPRCQELCWTSCDTRDKILPSVAPQCSSLPSRQDQRW